MTYVTETASFAEVFSAVLSALILWIWGLMILSYRRKGESPFEEDASQLSLYCAKLIPWIVGVVCILSTVWAFIPGNF
jgi:hypothetical protein